MSVLTATKREWGQRFSSLGDWALFREHRTRMKGKRCPLPTLEPAWRRGTVWAT